MKYNILILHNLGDFDHSLKSMVDYLMCFERYGPDHNYVYYRWTDPITPSLSDLDIHLVILDASALGVCRFRPRELYEEIKERWRFVAELDAVKIAFPQDDYHQSNVLDQLFFDWKVDIVYSVLPNQMEMLYPKSGSISRLKGVLTGYVDDMSIDMFGPYIKPFDHRKYDVGQRVSMYSPLGGRYSQVKGRMAEGFDRAAKKAGFISNISHRPEDSIRGDKWLQFLGDCKFTIGGEGGVSIWDPDGDICDRVVKYQTENPDATFEECEKACFAGEDGKIIFSAISPRTFESAIMKNCQILTEGEFLGILKPFEHYIPVKQDLTDIEDAVGEMGNTDMAKNMIKASYDVLIENPDLRYSGLVKEVFKDVDDLAQNRTFLSISNTEFLKKKDEIEQELIIARQKTKSENTVFQIAGLIPSNLRSFVPKGVKDFIKARF